MEELIVAKAVRLAGGNSTVARALNINQPHAVGKWVNRNRVPPYRIIPLEKLTKGKVTRHQLDPVLYPRK